MVQPAAMAGATFRAVCVSGKFQGVIIPTTPTGSLTRLIVERSEEHTSELQSRLHLVCRLLLEKKNRRKTVAWYHRAAPTPHRGGRPGSGPSRIRPGPSAVSFGRDLGHPMSLVLDYARSPERRL